MSISQGIFVGLVVVCFLGGLAEASTYKEYRASIGRYILALLMPLLWIALILWVPWSGLTLKLSIFFNALPWFVQAPLELLAFILIVAVAPAWFVFTIVVWTGTVMCGEVQAWLHRRIGHLQRHDHSSSTPTKL